MNSHNAATLPATRQNVVKKKPIASASSAKPSAKSSAPVAKPSGADSKKAATPKHAAANVLVSLLNKAAAADGKNLTPAMLFRCNLCPVVCSSQFNLDQHLRGHAHQKRVPVISTPLQRLLYGDVEDKNGVVVSSGEIAVVTPNVAAKTMISVHNTNATPLEFTAVVPGYADLTVTITHTVEGVAQSALTALPLNIEAGGVVYVSFEKAPTLSIGFASHLVAFAFANPASQFEIGRFLYFRTEDPDLAGVMLGGLGPSVPYTKKLRRRATIDGTKGILAGEKLAATKKVQLNGLENDTIEQWVRDGLAALARGEIDHPAAVIYLERTGESLTRDNYEQVFRGLIMAEESQQHIDIKDYDKDNVQLRRSGIYLSLEVPGLAESRPSVLRGDTIQLYRAASEQGGPVEGVVHRIELERLLMKFDRSVHNAHVDGYIWRLARFTVKRMPTRLQHSNTRDAKKNMMTLLFPGPATADLEPTGAIVMETPAPVPQRGSGALNAEQLCAVKGGLRRGLKAPYVIFGPPGTGKTTTLIELIFQKLASSPSERVIVTAPSNTAADLLASRLVVRGVSSRDILRINAFSRAKETVPTDVLSVSNWSDAAGAFEPPSLAALTAARVVVMTSMTASKYARMQVMDDTIAARQFTLAVMDEAGNSPEPEALGGFARFIDPNVGCVVIAGDHKQLPPIVHSEVAEGLKVSLLERLCRDGEGPHSPDASGHFDPSLVTMLVRNYRSHPAIIDLPSKLFYFDRLLPCADMAAVQSLCSWPGLASPGTDFPVLFHGLVGKDMREGNSPSWFNPDEAVAVVRHIESIVAFRPGGVTYAQIGVVTPYHKQKMKLQTLLKNKGMGAVTVGTTEMFQGNERRVIIISTVRSDPEMMGSDARHHLGFVGNAQRFNVAVTRAQALLVVVGNPNVLALDENWMALLKLCVEKNGYSGAKLPEDIFAAPGGEGAGAAEVNGLIAAIAGLWKCATRAMHQVSERVLDGVFDFSDGSE
jgi:helicase MOV-10